MFSLDEQHRLPGGYRIGRYLLAAGLGALAPLSCSPSQPELPVQSDLREAERVILEVDYMPGSTPATGPLSGGGLPWQVFQWNLSQLLPPDVKELSFPRTLEEMDRIEGSQSESFTNEEIKELAREVQSSTPGPRDALFHVLFLDGNYHDGSVESPMRRAVHLDGTRIFAVFGGAGEEATDFEALEEQSALVHEFGHALGLLESEDSGRESIPQVVAHSDGAGHCSVEGCIMNAHAQVSDALLDFANGAAVPLLFSPLCLQDLEAHYQAE